MFGGMSIVLSGLILLFAKYFLFIFTDDPAVIATTWQIVIYFVPIYFTWIIIEILSSVLRGVGDAIAPTVICAIGICVVRAIWIYTVFRANPNILTISLTYPVSWIVTDIAMIIYYRKGKWKEARLD